MIKLQQNKQRIVISSCNFNMASIKYSLKHMQVDEKNHYASFNIKTVTEITNNASGVIPENPDMKLASCL